MSLHHFFHVYADGEWREPVLEHLAALELGGLLPELDTFQIGIVGSDENVDHVLDELEGIEFEICARAPTGFEQETLDQLWTFSQDHDGLVLYAHTKGAANFAPINNRWRRSMLYFCVVDWRTPVEALRSGEKSIAGCHWFSGAPSAIPGFGHGGMFGGNFWWTRLELVRQNEKPTRVSRHDAEHWLGRLSEKMPITDETRLDLNPNPIEPRYLRDSWPQE